MPTTHLPQPLGLVACLLVAAAMWAGCSKPKPSPKKDRASTSVGRRQWSGLTRRDAKLVGMIPNHAAWAIVGDRTVVQHELDRFLRWIPYCPTGFETMRRNRALVHRIQAKAITWKNDEHPGSGIEEVVYAEDGTADPSDPTNWTFVFEVAGKNKKMPAGMPERRARTPRTHKSPASKSSTRRNETSRSPVSRLCRPAGDTKLICKARWLQHTQRNEVRRDLRFVPPANPFPESALGISIRLRTMPGHERVGSDRRLWIWWDGDRRFSGMLIQRESPEHEPRFGVMTPPEPANFALWSKIFDEFVLFQNGSEGMARRMASLLPELWKRLQTAGNEPDKLLPRVLTGRTVLGITSGGMALLVETRSPPTAASLMSKLDLTMGGQKGIEYRPSNAAQPASATISTQGLWKRVWPRLATKKHTPPVRKPSGHDLRLSIRAIGNFVAITTSDSILTTMKSSLVRPTTQTDRRQRSPTPWPMVIGLHLDDPLLAPMAPMPPQAVMHLLPRAFRPLVQALRCLAGRTDRLLIGIRPGHGGIAFAGRLSWLDLPWDDPVGKQRPYLRALRRARSHNLKAAMTMLKTAASRPDSKTTRKASRTLVPWFAQGPVAALVADLESIVMAQWKAHAAAQIARLGGLVATKLTERRPGPIAPTPSADLTPGTTCCRNERGVCPHPATDWTSPAWKSLDFSTGPDRFRYSVKWRRDGATWVLVVSVSADPFCNGRRLTGIRTWRFSRNGFHDLAPLKWHQSHSNQPQTGP
ncbi:MAG: hypothetical protein J7M25_04450 [Deltaproteobacteria bacterium]|nr:hypothetical protein [Deltaproteobacteria bacterium]